jgi:hypothetical protein
VAPPLPVNMGLRDDADNGTGVLFSTTN